MTVITLPDRPSSYRRGMNRWRSGARITNTPAIVLLVFSVLTGWATQFQSHCFSHEARTTAADHHQHQPELPAPVWANAAHDCQHCPPSECSRVAPCSTSAGGALIARVIPLVSLTAQHVDLPNRSDALTPSPIQPPTPPPQLIS